ncbi:MAG: helix-turn-helix domain-containing protein [Caldilineaceae bacterium]
MCWRSSPSASTATCELEGALNQLALQLDLHNRRLTYNEAAAMLEAITPNPDPVPACARDRDRGGLLRSDGRGLGWAHAGPRRSRGRARSLYLLREENQLSLPAIGGYLGNRDHTTIRYGVERISEQLGRDDEFARP